MRRLRPARAPLSALVAALLLAATAAAVMGTAAATRRERAGELERQAEAVADAVERRLLAYGEVLYGLRGLFEASDAVTRPEFRAYARTVAVRSRLPGLRAVSFADAVEGFDRARYEAAVRRELAAARSDYPRGFRVHPGGARLRHVAVSYIEPLAGNEAALGLDLLADPVRRGAVQETQDSGQVAATAPLRLVQKRRGPALLLVLALRDVRGALSDPSSGRLRGVFSGVVVVGDLVRGALPRASSARVEIRDVGPVAAEGPGGGSQVLFDSATRDERRRGWDHGRTAARDLQVAGRRWRLRYESRAPVTSSATSAAAWLVGAAGLLVSLLTATLVQSVSTRRRRAEELAREMTADLRRGRAELERSNRELERFAYVASHDLQEPLHTVTGFLGLLQRRHGERLDGRARRYVEQAVGAAERGSQLIADLLEYSRAGRLDAGDSRADLGRAWDRAAQLLGGRIEDVGARVSRGSLPCVRAPEPQMVRVFENLIANALTYRSGQAPEVRAAAQQRNGAWRVSVSDNGIGIEPEHRERVFAVFERLHTRDRYPGTGMGLAIVRRVVEAVGGTVGIDDADGGGTVFQLDLPVSDAPARPAAGPRRGDRG